jgi:hypothetical protein
MKLVTVFQSHRLMAWGRRAPHATQGHPGLQKEAWENSELQEAGSAVTRRWGDIDSVGGCNWLV